MRRHEDRHEAMAFAMRRSVARHPRLRPDRDRGLLCLLAASLNSNRGLGPVSALGIAIGLSAMLTLLPAILVITGRWVFWPFVPHYGSPLREESGLWARIGRNVSPRPRMVWIVVTIVLGGMAFGLLRLDTNLTQLEGFRGTRGLGRGAEAPGAQLPAGRHGPHRRGGHARLERAARGGSRAGGPRRRAGPAAGRAGEHRAPRGDPEARPYSPQAFDAIDALRQKVKAAAGAGRAGRRPVAIQLDVNRSATRTSGSSCR